MAQNITLLGASYTDVPAVELPKTGGGTATFTDTTPTTASASDVSQGKYFFTASGVLTLGTATGGGGGSVTQDQDGYIVLPSTGGGGGGGASNCVTGTFTTGNGGNTKTITVPYTGNGYPVFLTICLSEGVYNNSGTVYNTVHRFGILMVSSVKNNTVTPDYTGSGQNDYSTSVFRYKSSSSVPESVSGTTSNSGKYIDDTPKSDSAYTTIYINSATTFSIYVSPSSGTYGFIPNTEYTYAVMYSA